MSKGENEQVVTICYNKKIVWDSRKKAEDFFLEGAMCCDGSERERYFNVYAALRSGLNVCTDGCCRENLYN